MTITLSPRIEAALNSKGAEYDQPGHEYLKNILFAACHSSEGVLLKLNLPPPVIERDPAQPLLSLGGGTKASETEAR